MEEQETASLTSWMACLEKSEMPRKVQNLPTDTVERQAVVLEKMRDLLRRIFEHCDAFSKMPAADVQHQAVFYAEQLVHTLQTEHKCFIYDGTWRLRSRQLPSSYEELAAFVLKEVRVGYVDIEDTWRENAFSEYDSSSKAHIRLKHAVGLRAGALHLRKMTDHHFDSWQYRNARKQDCMLCTAETHLLLFELFGLLRCVSPGRAADDAYYQRTKDEEHRLFSLMPKNKNEKEHEHGQE